jgi:uncharacterized protein (TIGR00369 family)
MGIEITSFTTDTLTGRMPVNEHTIQPAGVLHGGASVALAETLASWAGSLTVDAARFHVVGQEINANHLRAGIAGQWVYGVASPIHVGRKTQVWEIRISNEAGKLLCAFHAARWLCWKHPASTRGPRSGAGPDARGPMPAPDQPSDANWATCGAVVVMCSRALPSGVPKACSTSAGKRRKSPTDNCTVSVP